ncbi:MAG: putative DNA base hypermodification protein [bacterium]|nr:putative DNA base hypermodification protein [bacterium]
MIKIRQAVYDTYWKFAFERQEIFYKKLSGATPPFTQDSILQTYKFCNVYRASDRVSQDLIKSIYSFNTNSKDILFRIFLFRLLNKTETWNFLEKYFGQVSLSNFKFKTYDQVLSNLQKTSPIYGNAFILCANKVYGFEKKHQNQLTLLNEIFIKTDKGDKLTDAKSLSDLFLQLRAFPLIGDFMAYQLAIDFNYSEVFTFDENAFTIAGPGAIRGINKCFEDTDGKSGDYLINLMVDNQEKEFNRLGLKFRNLWGRDLKAIDCQGLFCEVDKYSRVKFPELASNRVRIKAKYNPSSQPLKYFFPPKWGVNDKIK